MKKEFEDISAEAVDKAINSYIIGRNAARSRKIMHTILIDGITYEVQTVAAVEPALYNAFIREIKNILP